VARRRRHRRSVHRCDFRECGMRAQARANRGAPAGDTCAASRHCERAACFQTRGEPLVAVARKNENVDHKTIRLSMAIECPSVTRITARRRLAFLTICDALTPHAPGHALNSAHAIRITPTPVAVTATVMRVKVTSIGRA
jgi:hypothetical protein